MYLFLDWAPADDLRLFGASRLRARRASLRAKPAPAHSVISYLAQSNCVAIPWACSV